VLGGFAEVGGNDLTVLTDAAERPDEIDLARAEAAKDKALRTIQESGDKLDVRRAEHSLRRAYVRLDVSTYPIVRDRGGSV